MVETSVLEAVIKGGIKFYHLTGEIPRGKQRFTNHLLSRRGCRVSTLPSPRTARTWRWLFPSAYILGLEPSPPSPAVDAGRRSAVARKLGRAGSGELAAGALNAAVDAGLAATLIKVHDFWSSYTSVSRNAFTQSPATAISAVSISTRSNRISTMTSLN